MYDWNTYDILITFMSHPTSLLDDKSSLVQVMAQQWTGSKPLAEIVMTHFTNIHVSPGLK